MTTVAKVSQPGRLKASTADDEPERRELAEADMTPPVGGAVKGFVVRASSGIPFPLAQLLPGAVEAAITAFTVVPPGRPCGADRVVGRTHVGPAIMAR